MSYSRRIAITSLLALASACAAQNAGNGGSGTGGSGGGGKGGGCAAGGSGGATVGSGGSGGSGGATGSGGSGGTSSNGGAGGTTRPDAGIGPTCPGVMPASNDPCDILGNQAFCPYPPDTTCMCRGKIDGSGAVWNCTADNDGGLSCPITQPTPGSYCSVLSDGPFCMYDATEMGCFCVSAGGATNGMWMCITTGPPDDAGTGDDDAGVPPTDARPDTRMDAGSDVRVDGRRG